MYCTGQVRKGEIGSRCYTFSRHELLVLKQFITINISNKFKHIAQCKLSTNIRPYLWGNI